MEVFIRDEDKEKYEGFSLMGYYHTNRKGEENTNLKACLIQDIWVSDDDENLPKLTVKSLDQHDKELLKDYQLLLNVVEEFVFDSGDETDAEVPADIDFYKEIFSRYLLKFGRVEMIDNKYCLKKRDISYEN